MILYQVYIFVCIISYDDVVYTYDTTTTVLLVCDVIQQYTNAPSMLCTYILHDNIVVCSFVTKCDTGGNRPVRMYVCCTSCSTSVSSPSVFRTSEYFWYFVFYFVESSGAEFGAGALAMNHKCIYIHPDALCCFLFVQR